MVRVTIELVSVRGRQHDKTLGIIEIWNLFNKTVMTKGSRGDYGFRLFKKGKASKQIWKSGVISNFPRRRLGGYDLVFRVLLEAVGYRNKN